MRNLLVAAWTLGLGATGHAQDSRHLDVKNLFPNVGATIVLVEPNSAGVPPGFSAFGGATLIHERVALTAGHFTRVSEDGIPPFIKIFVTFNLHVPDDRAAWIPVVAQVWHPSTSPCPNNECNWTGPFPPPEMSDVGLVLLAEPVKFVKPARLAPPGTLEGLQGTNREQIMVGYGPMGLQRPVPPQDVARRYRVVAPPEIFNDKNSVGGLAEVCLGDSSSPTFLTPLPESGNNRQSVLGVTIGFAGNLCPTGKSGFARVDNQEVQTWIRQEIRKFLASGQ